MNDPLVFPNILKFPNFVWNKMEYYKLRETWTSIYYQNFTKIWNNYIKFRKNKGKFEN